MKAAILLLTTFLALFSVPVFAVGVESQEDTSNQVFISMDETISSNTANDLIHDLNVEFDRLSSKGYSHEDYDLLSESGSNLVINAVLPPNGSNFSDTEAREYLTGRSYLVDGLEKYATGLGNDPERVNFFHNAAWYANELIYAD